VNVVVIVPVGVAAVVAAVEFVLKLAVGTYSTYNYFSL
jgi:hypothetical protein